MSSVRLFALVFGIVYLLVGILGFVPGALHPEFTDARLRINASNGLLLGLFQVNALHSLVHILIGLAGLLAFRTDAGARGYARALVVVFLLLAVCGLIPGLKTVYGFIPLDGHDVWLHALTGLVAGYFGMVASAGGRDVTATPADRM